MSELVCIVCPRGCTMQLEGEGENLKITGNSCKRGEQFARSEMTMPMRTICTTAKTSFKGVPVVPVRVSAEIPKEKIFDVMKEINNIMINKPLKRGDAVLKNVLGLGVDIIVTSDLLHNLKN